MRCPLSVGKLYNEDSSVSPYFVKARKTKRVLSIGTEWIQITPLLKWNEKKLQTIENESRLIFFLCDVNKNINVYNGNELTNYIDVSKGREKNLRLTQNWFFKQTNKGQINQKKETSTPERSAYASNHFVNLLFPPVSGNWIN